jgi:hypothetical protein
MLDTYMYSVKLYFNVQGTLMSKCHMEEEASSSYPGIVYYVVVLNSSQLDVWTIESARCLDFAQHLSAKLYARKHE